MIFVVDELNIVHVKRCPFAYDGVQTYMTVPETIPEMIKHLLHPDAYRPLGSSHTHYGRPILVPCDTCLLGIDTDE